MSERFFSGDSLVFLDTAGESKRELPNDDGHDKFCSVSLSPSCGE